jgi:activator of HSP90 ATPase
MTADISASPDRIFHALLDSKQFAAFSGLAANIDPQEGGAFSVFNGQIGGRNIELVPNKRIVQAWRPTHWEPGVYSIVRFDLQPSGSGTLLTLDHKGFPAGDFDSLSSGWREHYVERLHRFFPPK